jgi:hypothetical protein
MAREAKKLKPIKDLKPLISRSDELPLEAPLLRSMHETMLKARCLEERLIAMYKSGHGYFWIGGPGEEAFNVPLGLLIKKGQGPAFDFCHFHYRQSATLLAMGEEPLGALRQMKNTASDPYSGGRNFAGHFAKKAWNIAPVSSPIEVQYSMVCGTALAQKRLGGASPAVLSVCRQASGSHRKNAQNQAKPEQPCHVHSPCSAHGASNHHGLDWATQRPWQGRPTAEAHRQVRPLACEPHRRGKRRAHRSHFHRVVEEGVADAERRGLQRESLVGPPHLHPMGLVGRLADKHRNAR